MDILERMLLVIDGLVALTYLGHYPAVMPRNELEWREPSFRSFLFRGFPNVPQTKVVLRGTVQTMSDVEETGIQYRPDQMPTIWERCQGGHGFRVTGVSQCSE